MPVAGAPTSPGAALTVPPSPAPTVPAAPGWLLTATGWTPAPAGAPPTGAARLWLLPGVPAGHGCPAGWARTLSPEEWARSRRQARPDDQQFSLICAGFRRAVLGQVLGLPPGELRWAAPPGAPGKPRLAPDQARRGGHAWHWNLAHAGRHVLLGVRDGREIGVDLETDWPAATWREVTPLVFSADERRQLPGHPVARLWTAKEAYLKACGQGFGVDPTAVSVRLHAQAIEVHAPAPGDDRSWWGRVLPPLPGSPGVTAALVTENPAPAVWLQVVPLT